MHESGCLDFQSHTYEHRFVPKWPQPQPLLGVDEALIEPHRRNPRPLEDDLQLAKRTIEGELGKIVEHLAFPNYRGTGEAIATARRLGYRGIWHGTLAHRKCNEPGDRADFIVRLSGEFLRRLPGRGRCDLGSILRRRYGASFRRMVGRAASTSTAHRPCAEAKVSS